jgi:hypothetical protein
MLEGVNACGGSGHAGVRAFACGIDGGAEATSGRAAGRDDEGSGHGIGSGARSNTSSGIRDGNGGRRASSEGSGGGNIVATRGTGGARFVTAVSTSSSSKEELSIAGTTGRGGARGRSGSGATPRDPFPFHDGIGRPMGRARSDDGGGTEARFPDGSAGGGSDERRSAGLDRWNLRISPESTGLSPFVLGPLWFKVRPPYCGAHFHGRKR